MARRSRSPRRPRARRWKALGAPENAGGTAGTGSNVPSYSERNGRSGAGSGNYEKTTETRNNGVALKTITKTQKAPGAVNQMNVALLIDKSVPANVATALEQTVGVAAGVDTTRGDTITSTQLAFAKPATPKAGPVPTTFLGPAKWVGLGLAALLFLLHDPRDEEAREREPDAGLAHRDLRAGLPGSARGGRRPGLHARPGFHQDAAPARPVRFLLNQLDQLMEREPERVAAQVKAWMAED